MSFFDDDDGALQDELIRVFRDAEAVEQPLDGELRQKELELHLADS